MAGTAAVLLLLPVGQPSPASGQPTAMVPLAGGRWTGIPAVRPPRTGNRAHNPIFGIGPQTLWKGGLGLGVETEISRHRAPDGARTEEEFGLHAHVDYGLTADVTLRLALPVVRRKAQTRLVPGQGQVERDATGVGDALLRAKWRFFHEFDGPTQYHAALIGGVKLPVADASGDPALGSGSTDFLGGATLSRDGLRYYLWGAGLVRVNGEAFGRKQGNEFRYDAAVGFRPWIPEWTSVDPLLLLEVNGLTAGRRVVGGVERRETGGTVVALSPGFWLTYRNLALKGGVKLPVLQRLRAEELELRYTWVVELETHW